ncbi:MAG TPA: YbhB/YbcL family Raf kinase inhibitor-like protein [Acidimicrobiales bacterium]|jgi:Raf kinase inhibitor-like YbhB/YbcL family protein|nr:YbhB/YbcL family Raf kinase inhibitor-like protein [Acidimicrobiales bacterium]
MPTPGSHSHDVRGTRPRDSRSAPPGARSDRASGPYGERTAGGDPGAVIELRSPAFSDQTRIPVRYSRLGDNVSPPLEWGDVPEATAELALLCEDPDAPSGTFLHWLVTGLPPHVRSLREGVTPPDATSWANDFGEPAYGGPQPPVGDDAHRYFFRLFALGSPLDIPPDARVDSVRRRLREEALATGTLVGLFAR